MGIKKIKITNDNQALNSLRRVKHLNQKKPLSQIELKERNLLFSALFFYHAQKTIEAAIAKANDTEEKKLNRIARVKA